MVQRGRKWLVIYEHGGLDERAAFELAQTLQSYRDRHRPRQDQRKEKIPSYWAGRMPPGWTPWWRMREWLCCYLFWGVVVALLLAALARNILFFLGR